MRRNRTVQNFAGECTMKIGDLVRCTWQPNTSAYVKGVGCIPMKHHVKGEIGIIVRHRDEGSSAVLFPHFGYEHVFANGVLEVINERR